MLTKSHLIAVISAVILILAGGTAFSIRSDYEDTVKARYALVRDMAKVVDDHIHRTVKEADIAIGLTSQMIDKAGGVESVRDSGHWEELRNYAAGVDGGRSIWIFDADGNPILESDQFPLRRINVADRAYFQAAKRGQPLFIGPAVRAKDGSVIFYPISRPILGKNGKFRGVILASMDTEWLTHFYAMMGFDMNPLIAVCLLDGSIVARTPELEKYIGMSIKGGPVFRELKKAPEGLFQLVSKLDGKSRFSAYRTVSDYNLLVITGIETKAALADWRKRSYIAAGAASLNAAFIILAILLFARASKREQDAKRALFDAIVVTEQMTAELSQARLDCLTSLPSRGLWLELVEAKSLRSQAEGTAMAIILVDLDDFKYINDQYGHGRGDEVLKAASDVLKDSFRETDIVGRLGGDEFVICATGSGEALQEHAVKMATRVIRRMLSGNHGIGCSVGINICPTGCADIDCAIRRADEAMYEAKRTGKSRVVVWGAPKEDGSGWREDPGCESRWQ